MSAGEDPARVLRRAVVASAVGTAIEWYDFFLYGVAAALVFPRVFFPRSDAFTGALLAFSTHFVGFVARPLGAAIFGHYGDRLGRKASLVATLLVMGLATTAIGLVPGDDRIGAWGAVLLVVGRVLQGIGVGGEWGGSVLLAAESGDRRRRGLLAAWPQFGAPAGLVLANGAVALVSALSGPAFFTWAWRLPFLASVALVGIGIYIRAGVPETPVFARLRAEGPMVRAPVLEVLRHHGREVVLTALLRTGEQTPFYLFSTFVLTYGTRTLHLPRAALLRDVMIGAALSMAAIPLWGHLSDRVGRLRMYRVSAAVMMAWAFVYYRMLDTRAPGWVLAAIALSMPIHAMQYGPQAAVIAESFPARVRYSGASLGYQLASITAGGPAPIVALWLLQRTGSSTAIAAYASLAAAVTLLAATRLRDGAADEL